MKEGTETKALENYIVAVRRALHACPELSSVEYKTSEYIERELVKIGLVPRRAHLGLIADIKGSDGKRTVALRADFDGLPITEKTGLPFASRNGCMHACGHDGHTAMLLGAAKYLSENAPKNNVRLIFQFGEEGDGGSVTMIENGATENADEIYAFHLCPELEFGKVGTNEGTLFAGVAEFNVTFAGKSVHCALKSEGADALAAAAEFTCKIGECGRENTLLHVGKFTSGYARNVVSDAATLECSFRFFDEKDRDPIIAELTALANACAAKYGCTASLTVKSTYPPLVNHKQCVRKLKKITETVEMKARYTAEDFAYYLKEIPGCMAWLGVKDEKHVAPLHSDTFDFDESILLKGARLFVELANLE